MNPHGTPLASPNRMGENPIPTRHSGLSKGLAVQALECANSLKEDAVLVWEAPAPGLDPLQWLGTQPSRPSFYWKERHGLTEYAGAGAAVTLTETGPGSLVETCNKADAILSRRLICASGAGDFRPRFFGGFAFDPSQCRGRVWQGFGDALLILPEALVVRAMGTDRLMLAMIVCPGDKIEAMLQRGSQLEERYQSQSMPDLPSFNSVTGTLESQMSLADWTASVQSALARIRSGGVNKIVLSRRFRLEGARLQPWPVMRRLRERVSSCFHFAFDLGGGHSFLGASPESLFYRKRDEVETECVAGTMVRGSDESSDLALADKLLSSTKEKLEHYFVVEEMLRSLGDLCDRLDVGARPHVLKLVTLQHLITNARGHLKPGRSSGRILASLHPTPAVGGSPRDAALAAIRDLEPESRGWYAGPVGWYALDEAEFAVAIRSVLLEDAQTYVFAGSGIVEGSTPDEEWQETESKALAFVNAIR